MTTPRKSKAFDAFVSTAKEASRTNPNNAAPEKDTATEEGMAMTTIMKRVHPEKMTSDERPALGPKRKSTRSRRTVAFAAPLVTSVRFVMPSSAPLSPSSPSSPYNDDPSEGGGDSHYMAKQIRRFQERALVEAQLNSRSRSVRMKAMLREAEPDRERASYGKASKRSRRARSKAESPAQQRGVGVLELKVDRHGAVRCEV
uniref:Uncharacterized protein n=1 Tax=Trieres chinensis TaxID=1514140 RepID=A0A7S1ZI73_TRICV|mmetsp:Transcript_26178/g.53617  ORF Transcript_26178/g.53617 Transcript_26178/m.53617 type:complete len:201 (+) Transcript_26178:79-681(+)|eukprot:CAMPEP_0183299940 /NCGR_PEP_ID=MMETSP0160_2-20130417/6517_1 /TAXON_ID=2839 ORGANISM="Odontella Sinensis, Strain Grunow 1884" /NCGR_SAMPLE_ID=MMETSP0160_2 /ASSEMBLY_ACC=CAM_ASM_000250 /LENGTH=200 /DNA_ID=CAMNT_0025462265 /DNA_START=58 /DNA_END=660 /DNA_ORIENTATION=-